MLVMKMMICMHKLEDKKIPCLAKMRNYEETFV